MKKYLLTREQMLDRIYEVVADKQLSLWCVLRFKEKEMDDKLWDIVLFKYVRQGSSSSEWYDWYKTQRWDLVCANMREWEFKFITKRYRNSMHWEPDEEWERICDELVNKYFTIVWHDVMIGDVLNRLSVIDYYLWYVRWTDEDDKIVDNILLKRKKLSKPIDEQSEECIAFIYSLCPQ